MSRRYFDIKNFFGNWRKSLNFGVFATLNLKFFWGSSPRPPTQKCNPPFLYAGYVPASTWTSMPCFVDIYFVTSFRSAAALEPVILSFLVLHFERFAAGQILAFSERLLRRVNLPQQAKNCVGVLWNPNCRCMLCSLASFWTSPQIPCACTITFVEL